MSARDEAAASGFDAVVRELDEPDVHEGHMFGTRNLLRGRQLFAVLYHGNLAARLGRSTPLFLEASALPGAEPWDPTDRDKPFKDWVVIPSAYVGDWPRYARAALERIRPAGDSSLPPGDNRRP